MATDTEINQRLISEWDHYLENKDKSQLSRIAVGSMGKPSLKEGMARRYSELVDESYVASMKDILPKVAPVHKHEAPMPMSTNLNVDRGDSLLDG